LWADTQAAEQHNIANPPHLLLILLILLILLRLLILLFLLTDRAQSNIKVATLHNKVVTVLAGAKAPSTRDGALADLPLAQAASQAGATYASYFDSLMAYTGVSAPPPPAVGAVTLVSRLHSIVLHFCHFLYK
jgi:hypothetical protein